MIKHCVPMNPKRDDFFRDLKNCSIIEIEKKYLPKSNLKNLSAHFKPFLYKAGIFSIYLSLKRKFF